MKKWTVRKRVWFPLGSIAALMLAGAAAISFVPAGQSGQQRARADALLAPKTDLDEMKPGHNEEARIGANEQRNSGYSPNVEAYLQRAYPEQNVPTDASFAAQTGWAALNSESHSGGSWQLIGPSKATFPGVLNALGDGAQVVVAGRVTVAVRAALLGADVDVRDVDAADAEGLGAVVTGVSDVAEAVSTPVAPGARTSDTF